MKYKTEPSIELREFLKRHPHDYFTVKQIESEILENNGKASVSTIYRHLSKLVATGEVKKIYHLNDDEALYRYSGDEACMNEIHVICSSCGKMFHLKHNISDYLKNELNSEYGFQLDYNKTVISGICKECLSKKVK